MNKYLLALLMIFGSLAPVHPAVEIAPPSPDQILNTLKPGHPRLMIDAVRIAQIRALISQDSLAAGVYERVRRDARRILTQEPSIYEIPDGRRLLSVSRRVKERVRTLAFVYLMEGDERYVDRAWAEIEAAALFQDWNPSHFLDTAEMTFAFSLAYDWLFDRWTDDQRRLMREAMIEKGLKPGLEVYRRDRGWVRAHNNWNQVCNGGLAMGALAIADEEPELAAEIIHSAIKSLPLAMSFYGPDGASPEGVTYWSYGTRYNIKILTGLETALGTDFGLSKIPGFKESGDFHIYVSGADRMAFNFADCGLSRMSSPMHFWMGKKFGIPHYTWFRYDTLRQYGGGAVLDLLWFEAQEFDPSTLPLDKRFRKVDMATMRSSWTDPDALVLGIQAGGNMNLRMHRHLDQGTFILEALGQRWAIDSGTERETYQTHRNKRRRWEFYRIRAEGHNTLVFNPREGPDQNPAAQCEITRFESTPDRSIAVLDLTDVYAEDVERAQRTFEMIDRAYVVVTDEVTNKKASELYWFMHTQADVQISEDGKTATLSQNNRNLTATLQSPERAVFKVMPAEPLPTSPTPDQAGNKGRRKLAIHLTDVKDLTIKVRFTPVQPE